MAYHMPVSDRYSYHDVRKETKGRSLCLKREERETTSMTSCEEPSIYVSVRSSLCSLGCECFISTVKSASIVDVSLTYP